VRIDAETSFADLYARCVASDEERAWGELIRRFDSVVLRAAAGTYRVLVPGRYRPEDIEDARQETWMRLIRNNRRHVRTQPDRSEGEFHVYLRTTAANVVRDHLKAERSLKRPKIAALDAETLELVLSQARHDGPSPDEWTHTQQIVEQITPILRRHWSDRPTCERDIAICNLALMDGVSAARIASIESFGLSRGGVEKVIERGRRILRRHFGGPGARSRFIDGDRSGEDGPPPPDWRDPDEIVAFVLGELDEWTTAQRMALLSRDARARRALTTVASLMEAPLDDALSRELQIHDGVSYFRKLRRKVQREDRPSIFAFPRWPRTQLAQAIVATAALLTVVFSPLIEEGRRGPTPTVVPVSSRLIPSLPSYPQDAVAPLRLPQPFAPEGSGPMRGTVEPVDEDRLLEVEDALILERSEGKDPVAISNALGHLKLARGRFELAARNYSLALRHDPLNAEALIGLSVVRYHQAMSDSDPTRRQELLEQADEMLARVEPSSPLYLQALYDRVYVALAGGRLDEAVQLAERYHQWSGDDGWMRALRAAVERSRTSTDTHLEQD